jgi:hypothetical protein
MVLHLNNQALDVIADSEAKEELLSMAEKAVNRAK